MDLFDLEDDDRFLLCSDGVDKHVTDPEIAQYLRGDDPAAVTQALIDLTLARGAVDNVSVCVVRISEP